MSTFHGILDGHVNIPGAYAAAGGMMNFNINYTPAQASSTQTSGPFSTLLFAQDPDFVDRQDILVWIRDKCAEPGTRAALVGLGGIGHIKRVEQLLRPKAATYESLIALAQIFTDVAVCMWMKESYKITEELIRRK
ncbi:hypothetical protein MPH_11606 [Macrophomina phaseolina MS6]|uniref:Uncharacterized protein n=1 Tax=Macrophomina phaseolina (strain MS6) TaxID=1126212 RepID=K2REC1_MACPH|nr:hypothetical protein MPH_11606 [Macrophomina phaseolina MS6]